MTHYDQSTRTYNCSGDGLALSILTVIKPFIVPLIIILTLSMALSGISFFIKSL